MFWRVTGMRPISTCEMFTTRQTKLTNARRWPMKLLGKRCKLRNGHRRFVPSLPKLKRRKGTGVSQRAGILIQRGTGWTKNESTIFLPSGVTKPSIHHNVRWGYMKYLFTKPKTNPNRKYKYTTFRVSFRFWLSVYSAGKIGSFFWSYLLWLG